MAFLFASILLPGRWGFASLRFGTPASFRSLPTVARVSTSFVHAPASGLVAPTHTHCSRSVALPHPHCCTAVLSSYSRTRIYCIPCSQTSGAPPPVSHATSGHGLALHSSLCTLSPPTLWIPCDPSPPLTNYSCASLLVFILYRSLTIRSLLVFWTACGEANLF